MSSLHYDPTAKVGLADHYHGRKRLPWAAVDGDPARVTADEAGTRSWDVLSRSWMLDRIDSRVPRPKSLSKPAGDGSRVYWEVVEYDHRTKRWGQVVFVIEAACLDRAIAEKSRLCRERGWRPGWGRVRPM